MTPEEAVKNYQCPGCADGCYEQCFKKNQYGCGCIDHYPGTAIYPVVGKIFLGMPKGFNRIGSNDGTKIFIYETKEQFDKEIGYNEYTVPVWKALDEHGNTLVRMYAPRLNSSHIHIFLGNYMDEIDAIDVTEKMKEMD